MIIKLKLQPHIKNFMIQEFDLDENRAIDIENDDYISRVIRKAIHPEMKHLEQVKMTDLYSEEYPIRIMNRHSSLYLNSTSNHTCIRFHKVIHDYMHDLLNLKIQYGMNQGMQMQEVIWEFMRHYNLVEVISFDALKKTNYRLRKKMKSR